MSSTSISFISRPNSISPSHNRNATTFMFTTAKPSCKVPRLKPQSLSSFFIKIPYDPFKDSKIFTPYKPFSPVMKWQDCMVKMEMDVPASVAYKLCSDPEAIPNWMPFVSSVKVFEDKPELSQWNVKYKILGRKIEYSWLAKNLQPIPNQKIHWISVEGVGNRGAVRFYPRGPSSCLVEVNISYEVPRLLTPVASLLQPFMEKLLERGMLRFAKFAKSSSYTR